MEMGGWHASFHEMSESRLVKPKDMKKEIFPFMLLSCGLGHRRISSIQGFIRLWYLTIIASRQGQGFISRATPHAFPFTNPRHTLLSCIILLACLTSKPPSNSPSGYQSTSSAAYQHTLPLSNPVVLHPLHMAELQENTFINLFCLHPSSPHKTALAEHSGLYPFSRYPAEL